MKIVERAGAPSGPERATKKKRREEGGQDEGNYALREQRQTWLFLTPPSSTSAFQPSTAGKRSYSEAGGWQERERGIAPPGTRSSRPTHQPSFFVSGTRQSTVSLAIGHRRWKLGCMLGPKAPLFSSGVSVSQGSDWAVKPLRPPLTALACNRSCRVAGATEEKFSPRASDGGPERRGANRRVCMTQPENGLVRAEPPSERGLENASVILFTFAAFAGKGSGRLADPQTR